MGTCTLGFRELAGIWVSRSDAGDLGGEGSDFGLPGVDRITKGGAYRMR